MQDNTIMTASENAENISILRAKMKDFINNEVIPQESVLHQENQIWIFFNA